MDTMAMNLKRRFLQLGAFKTAPPGQPFKLQSGKESNFYINAKQAILDRQALRTAAFWINHMLSQAVSELLPSRDVAIGTTGAICPALLGAALGCNTMVRTVNGFVVRSAPKDHGLKTTWDGDVKNGDYIVFLDDVLTTGDTIIRSVNTMQTQGIRGIDHVIVLFDREENDAAAKLSQTLSCKVESLLKRSMFDI